MLKENFRRHLSAVTRSVGRFRESVMSMIPLGCASFESLASRNSSVSIVTILRAGRPGFFFSLPPRPDQLSGPPSPPIQREADYTLPSVVDVPIRLRGVVLS